MLSHRWRGAEQVKGMENAPGSTKSTVADNRQLTSCGKFPKWSACAGCMVAQSHAVTPLARPTLDEPKR
jgi:hypothetical protein